MTITTCDICGKKMPSAKVDTTIKNLNFSMSSYGRIWDICNECRVDLNGWMTMRREEESKEE